MKILRFIISACLFVACSSGQQNKPLADLNLYFDSDIKIDSILVTNITQDREFHIRKYASAINIDLNDSINDLYAISFYSGDDHRMAQLWLNGEKLIIKGKVTDGIKIQVDTVIGSDLYDKSLDFRKKYQNLLDSKSDSSILNKFLITELKNEVNNPLSIEIAKNFVNQNISDNRELKKVFTILSAQDESIKKHLLNPYRKIETILSVNKIDFSKYHFYDRDKTLTSIELSGDRKYLLDFWFIGCAPCIQDHKAILKKTRTLHDNNVEVIGISIDNSQEQWKNFLVKNNYPWKNYREVDEHENRMRTKMLIDVFPTYLLLDSNGVILHRANAFSEIEKYLDI